jgi:DNA-binding response OmpR family regulator
MFRLLMISDNSEHVRELSLGLAEGGFLCSIACAGDDSLKDVGALSADLVVVAIDGAAPGAEVRKLPRRLKEKTHLPVVTLLSSKSLDVLDSAADVDDFVMEPWDTAELIARVKRILNRRLDGNSKDMISCGEVTIDPAKCQVAFRGRLVDLTFREYELLKFLAGNKGKVFSRDALLDKVWGYDFYGGDRTVDVHVRRLRSKLDESGCIETVRNIGYRFREDA